MVKKIFKYWFYQNKESYVNYINTSTYNYQDQKPISIIFKTVFLSSVWQNSDEKWLDYPSTHSKYK